MMSPSIVKNKKWLYATITVVVIVITLVVLHNIVYGQQNSYGTVEGYVGAYVIDYYNLTLITLAKHHLIRNGTLVSMGSGTIQYVLITSNGKVIPLPGKYYHIGEKVIYNPTTKQVTVISIPTGIHRHDPPWQLPVYLVGMAFPDDSFRPPFSQIISMVFGGFPSVANYWWYASLGQLELINQYSNAWGVLPNTSSYYCSLSNPLYAIANDTIYYMYKNWGVMLQNYTILMIYTNEPLPCQYYSPGMATIGLWQFTAPYGTVYVAVSIVYYYNYTNLQYYDIASPSRFIGYNLGFTPILTYYGTPLYLGWQDYYDLMGYGANWVWMYTPWGGYGSYSLPIDINAFYKWIMGWVNGTIITPNQLTAYYDTTLYCSSVNYNLSQSVIIINETNDLIALSLTCYTSLNPYQNNGFYGLFPIYYNMTTGQTYLYSIDGSPYPWGSNLLWYWQALIKDYLVQVQGQLGDQFTYPISVNLQIIQAPANISSLFNQGLQYGTFVVGASTPHGPLFGAYTTDVASAIVFAGQGRVDTYVPLPGSYIDTQIATWTGSAVAINYSLADGRYIIAFGGPLVNYITYTYNPPNTIGYGGLPFFYNSTAGGIEDARTGQVYTGNVFLVAIVYNPSIDKYIVLVWGLSGIDTEAAGVWLANYGYYNYRAVIVEWTNTTGLPAPSPQDQYIVVDHWP